MMRDVVSEETRWQGARSRCIQTLVSECLYCFGKDHASQAAELADSTMRSDVGYLLGSLIAPAVRPGISWTDWVLWGWG